MHSGSQCKFAKVGVLLVAAVHSIVGVMKAKDWFSRHCFVRAFRQSDIRQVSPTTGEAGGGNVTGKLA